MVSYNTLAGAFTSDAYAHNVLYPYCDPGVLRIEYRQGRIVHELLGYNADVLCLQEVGTDTFEQFFLPALNSKGYDGCYVPKSGMVSALFHKFAGTAKNIQYLLSQHISTAPLHPSVQYVMEGHSRT
jgi:mRNA deadenylase 3'-5' endonuclease subunit Ccr4